MSASTPRSPAEPPEAPASSPADAAEKVAAATAQVLQDAAKPLPTTTAVVTTPTKRLAPPLLLSDAAAQPGPGRYEAAEAMANLFSGAVRFGQENLQRNLSALSSLLHVKNLQDLLSLQIKFGVASMAAGADEFNRVTDLIGKVPGGAWRPAGAHPAGLPGGSEAR